MTDESRGKRRKQANPRRNRECSLGSEGEDEGGAWGTDVQDERTGQDKMSLTPSEGTEAGSPCRSTRAPSLSPSLEQWDESENMALPTTPGESENSAYTNKDAQMVEDWTRYDFLMQLRRVSNLSHPRHSQHLNGSIMPYHTSAMPALIQKSPENKDVDPESPDGTRTSMQVCPFCHRSFQYSTYLSDHMKLCQEREEGHNVCPLCGYSTPYRAQMEHHMELHAPSKVKNPVTPEPNMENRKFKCTQCGKAFKYKHHLKEHLRIHSGEKPYECSNCKKRFSHSGSYSSHLSSKKCLSGGGPGNGTYFNGHAHPAYPFPSPTSPPGLGSRTVSRGKISPYAPLSHYFTDQTANQGQDSITSPLQSPDLGRMWDPAAALRMGAFQGTTLLPLLQSGGKFEQLLQKMLRKEVVTEDQQGSRQEKDKDNKAEDRNGKTDVLLGAVSCQWCFQLFPNEVVLKQHERYSCKNKEQDVAQLPLHRTGSPLNFSHVSQIPHANQKTPATPNGKVRDLSSSQQGSWHSVPQQLLVPLQSPMHLRHERAAYGNWIKKQTGSPTNSSLMSPTSPSLQESQHPFFNSPPYLDLSVLSPSRSAQHRPLPKSESSQTEPLDLSMPKLRGSSEISKAIREKNCNIRSPLRSNGDIEHLKRHSPSQHQVSGTYTPMLGPAAFNNYPFFSPIIPNAGLGHNGLTPLSMTPPAPSPGFLSPITYMMETDAETILKRMQHERFAMGEIRNNGCLDYLSLMDEGMDGDNGPSRKRLRKTEEGLYACDICDKSFQKSSSLLRHKYEHTGKRPHECQICKKAFKHKHHLIEHSRLHSGEKPYQCDKCGKRFSHSGSYSQHMNHRYAFCGRDNDTDGPVEDNVVGDLTLYTSSHNEPNPNLGNLPLALEETSTFLSDSSLDGGPLGFRAEDDDDDELTSEDEKKEEEIEEKGTKMNNHGCKIKVQQNEEDQRDQRDRQDIKLETV